MGSPLYRLGVGTATLTSPITMGGGPLRRRSDVRFGSKADMCSAKRHVRFTPNSDRESGFPQTVMSALPPKADICGATRDVRFGPKADIVYSITSSALASSVAGTARPKIRAVWALITSSNLFDCKTGRSDGLAPAKMRPT